MPNFKLLTIPYFIQKKSLQSQKMIKSFFFLNIKQQKLINEFIEKINLQKLINKLKIKIKIKIKFNLI
jgi:hypothetical protein